MKTLYQTLEHLALETAHGEDISQTTRAVALIFHDEILQLPWPDRQMARDKLAEPRATRHLIALVLREMQRHAREILLEQGCGVFEASASRPLSAEHAAIVQRVWDGRVQAPAWNAFASQIIKLERRYADDE